MAAETTDGLVYIPFTGTLSSPRENSVIAEKTEMPTLNTEQASNNSPG